MLLFIPLLQYPKHVRLLGSCSQVGVPSRDGVQQYIQIVDHLNSCIKQMFHAVLVYHIPGKQIIACAHLLPMALRTQQSVRISVLTVALCITPNTDPVLSIFG